MAITIRIHDRWTAQVDDGVWRVIEGPPEIATALNVAAGRTRSRSRRSAAAAGSPHSLSWTGSVVVGQFEIE
jgi:hypothetical protein